MFSCVYYKYISVFLCILKYVFALCSKLCLYVFICLLILWGPASLTFERIVVYIIGSVCALYKRVVFAYVCLKYIYKVGGVFVFVLSVNQSDCVFRFIRFLWLCFIFYVPARFSIVQ